MAACETLKSYSIFVSKVRQYIKDSKKSAKDKNSTIINCINRAIDDCITNNILKEFFLKYRKEVVEASMWDYNEELHYKTVAEVKYQDGFKGGVKIPISCMYGSLIRAEMLMSKELLLIRSFLTSYLRSSIQRANKINKLKNQLPRIFPRELFDGLLCQYFNYYLLRLVSSSRSVSDTVMIRLLAWKPRCVVIISVNSLERSTFDISSTPVFM